MFTDLEVDLELDPPMARDRGLLLNVARRIGDGKLTRGGVNRIGAGVTWKPWGTLLNSDDETGFTYFPTDTACDPADEFEKAVSDLPANVKAYPFAIYRMLQCSALSGWANVLAGRVETDLRIFRSYAFERALIGGGYRQGNDEASLAGEAAVVSATASSLLTQIAALENWFAVRQPGAVAIIHLTPGLLVKALAEGIVEFRDGQYRTATGSVVIGDPGQTGADEPTGQSNPSATEAWIYITGDIWYAESPIPTQRFDGDGNGEFELLRNNDRILRELMGLVLFDPNVVGAALVDATASESGGGGGGGDASAANQLAALAILEDLDLSTDQLETLLAAMGTNTDGLEALIGTTNTRLQEIEDRIANVETSAADLQDALTADAATLSNVNSADSSTSLLASNSSRRGVIIHNDDDGDLYVKYGATASVTSYTYKIPPDGTWEMPGPIYTGAIDGIWTSSGAGAARITELT